MILRIEPPMLLEHTHADAQAPVAWDWDGFAEAHAHYISIGLAPPIDAS
ncbi:MAG: hypothetical protein J2P58_15320 [Acidimicrobiaceae bacterium]|nr:hypothetical protein [Acidimicrobiaceae bacterium]